MQTFIPTSLSALVLCIISSSGFAATMTPHEINRPESPDKVIINNTIMNNDENLATASHGFVIDLAANQNEHEQSELDDEISDFNEEMKSLGKELKGMVKILRKMGDKDAVKGSFLGILLDDDADVEEGVKLIGVTPEGPAQQAGLQADDIILSINNNSMAQQDKNSPLAQLRKTMKKVKPGDTVIVVIDRNGTQKKIELTTGKRADHLQYGINFLADDIEKKIQHKLNVKDDIFSDIELYPINEKLGTYFGVDTGLLILNIPKDNDYDLQQGDVILKIGQRTPKTTSQTWRILQSYDSGEKIDFLLMREQKEISLSITKP